MKNISKICYLILFTSTLCLDYISFQDLSEFGANFRKAYQPYTNNIFKGTTIFPIGFNQGDTTVFAYYFDYNRVLLQTIPQRVIDLASPEGIRTSTVENYMNFLVALKSRFPTFQELIQINQEAINKFEPLKQYPIKTIELVQQEDAKTLEPLNQEDIEALKALEEGEIKLLELIQLFDKL